MEALGVERQKFEQAPYATSIAVIGNRGSTIQGTTQGSSWLRNTWVMLECVQPLGPTLWMLLLKYPLNNTAYLIQPRAYRRNQRTQHPELTCKSCNSWSVRDPWPVIRDLLSTHQPYNLQLTACNLQRATSNLQPPAVPWWLVYSPCSPLLPLGWFHCQVIFCITLLSFPLLRLLSPMRHPYIIVRASPLFVSRQWRSVHALNVGPNLQ